jgi:hypothetical protein
MAFRVPTFNDLCLGKKRETTRVENCTLALRKIETLALIMRLGTC